MSGVKQVQQKRKAAHAPEERAILGPRSKARRDVAEFAGGRKGEGGVSAAAAAGAAAARGGVAPPGVPPLLGQRVPGAHVMEGGQKAQLARVLKLVVD